MTEYQRQVQLQLPSPSKLLTPTVITCLVLMVIGFALAIYAREFTFAHLAISQSCFFSGNVWQLVTYSFVNGGCGLAFNGLVVLFFGSAVERQWRTTATIILALTVIVICGLVWFLVSMIIGTNFVGYSTQSLAYGLVASFGILFRKQKFFFFLWTVEAQTISWIFIIIGLVYSIANPVSLIWVSGAVVAYLYIKARWFLLNRRDKRDSPSMRTNGFVDLD